MPRRWIHVPFVLAALMTPPATFAQPVPAGTSVSVPHLINVSGVFQPVDGQPPAAVEVVTLSIYADAEGGLPLWQEMQTVAVDQAGRFNVLLGATHPNGIPSQVFASGEPQWMSMHFARVGELERPRVRIASVPYALKASDAETLGGLPASAYLRAPASGTRTADPESSMTVTAGDALPTEAVVLSGTTNYLAKYVNGADVGNSAVYETGGFVGVGTTAPVDTLHLQFNDPSGARTGLAVQNLGNTATSYSGMLFYDHTGALAQFQGFNNATHEYRINNVATNPSINFMTASTSRFFVAPTGNVGIGTTSPQAKLDVNGSSNVGGHANFAGHVNIAGFLDLGALGTNPDVRLSVGGPNATTLIETSPVMQLSRPAQSGIKNTNSVGFSVGSFETGILGRTRLDIKLSGLPTESNTYGTIPDVTVMTMQADGKVGIGITPTTGKLTVFASDLPAVVATSTNWGGVFGRSVNTVGVFGQSDNNNGVVGVSNSGGMGVRGESIDGYGVYGQSLNNFAGYFSGNVYVTGTVTQNSDRRLKTAVNNLHYGLPEVLRLRPVSWNWKDRRDRGLQLGLIAQDVEEVLPELVTTGKDAEETKGVNYLGLLPVVINAIQEQQRALDEKETVLKSLSAENAGLQQRVEELERLVSELLAATPRQ